MIPVSEGESEIRGAVVERIRSLLPSARIIHELNVEHGAVRADVAAVGEDRLYLFEIKSARDKLHRLGNQVRYFHPACHGLIVVADEKWCGRATELGYPNCDARKIIAHHGRAELWQWPEPERAYGRDWTLPPTASTPWPWRMLNLLWAEELRQVAGELKVSADHRSPGYKLAKLIAAQVPGAEIERAVCDALRKRQFAYADDPMMEAA